MKNYHFSTFLRFVWQLERVFCSHFLYMDFDISSQGNQFFIWSFKISEKSAELSTLPGVSVP